MHRLVFSLSALRSVARRPLLSHTSTALRCVPQAVQEERMHQAACLAYPRREGRGKAGEKQPGPEEKERRRSSGRAAGGGYVGLQAGCEGAELEYKGAQVGHEGAQARRETAQEGHAERGGLAAAAHPGAPGSADETPHDGPRPRPARHVATRDEKHGWSDAARAHAEEQEPLPAADELGSHALAFAGDDSAAGRFADYRRILFRGGTGGRGCVAYRREPFVRGPKLAYGANGGDGGDVVLVADGQLACLGGLLPTIIGLRGSRGEDNQKLGRCAEDLHVRVPVGTIVRTAEGDVMADLVEDGQSCVVVRGGKGGRGNTGGRADSRVRDPFDERVDGVVGDEVRVTLELKTMADVGLVGMPSAGKSTFLRAVSNAHPKVAPYPFTTINPHLGVVDFDDYWRMRVADVPGLVAGAHANIGMGHRFLRHIERNRALLYVLDLSEDIGSLPPWEALAILQDELERYQPGMTSRPAIVAANKADRPTAAANLKRLRVSTSLPVFPVSAATGAGVRDVTSALRKLVETERKKQERGKGASFMDALLMER